MPNQRDQTSVAYEPVAIIGIGCRFPGDITSPATFWNCLRNGADGTSEVPETRWSLERHFDPKRGRPGKLYARRGGFIRDVTGFDPQFFGISPREAACMDPQQRLLLETTWEAFEDAGIAIPGLARRKVGVFIGLFTHDYENIHMRTSERHLQSPHSATGMSTTISANRLSYAFDFMGPSMIIDTACSSSLVAVHLAARALQSAEAEIAVAGGVNLQLSPDMTMALSNASMLSPDGRSMSFDARANGYARADGVGVVVLKPLRRALEDGNPIYAVIAGSAVNQDGHTPGISVPNGEAQQIVMREALAAAGIGGGDISYVEAHGTGTPVGDPIEAGALGAVLAAEAPERVPCVIGSIKSNFGHAESAAGIAGLIKVALMQQHGMIPANLHFETPNPAIAFDELRLRVPTALEDWPAHADGRRFAGINSFGFGGSNAHVILGRAPQQTAAESSARHTQILPLSARGEEALRASAANLAGFLRATEGAGAGLDEIAAELALARAHLDERLVIVADNHETAITLLDGFCHGERMPGLVSGRPTTAHKRLAFVCSGMGQQWWGMGRELIATEPVFAAKVSQIDALFSKLGNDLPLAQLFVASESGSKIDRTEYAQRAIFAVQVGLAALWESVGIRPDMVIGHSVGEVAAAQIAGALSLEDAVTISFHRSRLQARLAGCGGMMAVGLSEAAIQPYLAGLEELVSLAAVNSPGSVTLAGDVDALRGLLAELEAGQIFARMLNVEVPYHSPVMDRITGDIPAVLQGIAPRPARIPLVSTVTGARIDGTDLGADYWVRNVREPVYFRQAMQALAEAGCTGFIELGAHPVLSTSIRECLAADGAKNMIIASQNRKLDGAVAFWSAVGQLHCSGHDIPFERLYQRSGKRIALPTYPWQRSPYWLESKESHLDRTGRLTEGGPKAHPLLGDRQVAPLPAWRAAVSSRQPAFLEDHKVQGSVVFPGAGYVEAALAACCAQTDGHGPLILERLVIEAPLVLGDAQPTTLQTSLGEGGRFEFHAHSGKPGDKRWTRHATGTVRSVQETGGALGNLDWPTVQARLPRTEAGSTLYAHFEYLGLGYGPAFRNIETAWIGEDEVLGRLRAVAAALPDAEAGYVLHPAVLDSAFQLLAALPIKGSFLPVGVERISVYKPGGVVVWAHGRLSSQSKSRIMADLVLADEAGAIICTVEGLACQLFESAARAAAGSEDDFLFVDSWVDTPLDADRCPEPAALPDLDQLVQDLQARHQARDAEGIHRRTVAGAWPRLDALALEYFAEALAALGWSWKIGQCIRLETLLNTLGIADRHRAYVAHMLGLLAKTGVLEAEKGNWRVLRLPECGQAAAHWRALAAEYPHCHAELVLTQRCGAGLTGFLRGEDEALFALFPKGCPIAEQFYTDGPILKPYNRVVADLVRLLVGQLPSGRKLRILEVGSGTGGLAAHVLPLLPPERTEYLFTDLSDRFLGQARQRFRNRPFVRYEKLDLDADPVQQGFMPGSFDLVLGSDVVHATADLTASLGKLRDLLKPGGAMALIELTATPAWIDLIFGLLPGWWAFADTDLRPDHATLPVSGWLDAFKRAGLKNGAAVVDAFGQIAGPHSIVLATRPTASGNGTLPETDAVGLTTTRPVFLLGDACDAVGTLRSSLQGLGAQVQIIPAGHGAALQEALARWHDAHRNEAERDMPCVVDLGALQRDGSGAPGLPPADETTQLCLQLQTSLRTLVDIQGHGRHQLWVVTRGAQRTGAELIHAPDLAAAALWGFTRTAANELDTIETHLVDLGAPCDPQELAALAREILSDSREPEVALRGTRRLASRVHRWRKLRATDAERTMYDVCKTELPVPEDLSFREFRPVPPAPGEVQLRLRATGVNFKDFAVLSGLVAAEEHELGLEASGTVLATGPGVTAFSLGDAVFGFVRGGMKGVVNVPAHALVRKPENLTFEEAAGIPVVFLSAWHALVRQAQLQEGQTVLVHTAASGLGLAAIAVARARGARVLATAGTPEKRAYLKALGIHWVGDSRSARFAREVMEQTCGAGVDIVLNTLPAELNEHNFALLKPRTGRLVDVANVHYNERLAYRSLVRGNSVSAFDLMVLAQDDFAYLNEMLGELATMFASGKLRPLPYRTVSLERVSEVLHGVGSAAHIGKLIVNHADAHLPVAPTADRIEIAGEGCYLITGGLTGFGLATAQWLAGCGARNLVLIGRRGAETPDAAAALAQLEAAGVNVQALACDVADAAQLAALIARFGDDLPQLRGVIHGAMVLRDGPLRDMTPEAIHTVLAPKIDGAWHLHELTLDQPLDFFICHSSISGLIGNRDQANYAAANLFLEALIDMRRAMGLPGLAIGWGMIGETGAVARDQEKIDIFLRQGVHALPLDKAWATLSLGLRENAGYLGALVADWRKLGKFARVIANTPRFGLVAHGMTALAADAAGVQAKEEDSGAAAKDVASLVIREIAGVLGLATEAVVLEKPLAELGFDTLMAVELSLALEMATGQGFSRMSLLRADLTAADLIAGLGDAAAADAPPAASALAAPTPSPVPSSPAIDVEQLSDSEVDALLQRLATSG